MIAGGAAAAGGVAAAGTTGLFSTLGLCGAMSACCSAMSALCCVCTTAQNFLSCCTGSVCKGEDGKGVSPGKLGSMLVMLYGLLVMLLFQYALGKRMQMELWTAGACSDNGGHFEKRCLAQQGVFRVSLGLVAFFGLMSMGSLCSRSYHNALWAVKIALVFGGLLMAALFVPASVIEVYIWVARAGGAVFAVLQMVVIVDVAYAVNEYLVSKSNADPYSRSESNCGSLDDALALLLGIAIFLFSAAFVGIVLMFVYYAECPTTTAFVAMTLVLCVGVTLTQLLLPTDGNLLTSSAVCAYAVFVAYTAISRNPHDECRSFNGRAGRNDWVGVTIGLFLAISSIVWTTYSSGGAVADLLHNGRTTTPTEGTLGRELLSTSDDAEAPALEAPMECLDGGDTEAIRFDLAFMLGAMNVACVLTNWGTWEYEQKGEEHVTAPLAGAVSMWLNISAQWILFLIYIWTLVAPLIFPNRDFS